MKRASRFVIVVDVGNTSTAVGLAEGRAIRRVLRLPTHTADPAGRIRDLLGRLPRGRDVRGALLCSVVPARNRVWCAALRAHCGQEPLVLSHRLQLNVRVDYPRPATIGADRLANACAAWERYGGPVIVADFGTALTLDLVTADGRYVGGVIAPGLPLMTDYLCEKTALLPRVRLAGGFGPYGRSTREAMRIGALVGYRGMVRELVRHVRPGLRGGRLRLCATGGYAARVVRGLGLPVALRPNLTLEGLALVYEMNERERAS